MNMQLTAVIEEFPQRRLLVVGDLMLDEYLWGEAERVSPEAPVQVVEVRDRSHTLGGAGNVAKNIAALGAQVELVALTGDDPAAELLQRELERMGIGRAGVLEDPARTTTRKTRVMARAQQVLRLDWEQRTEIPSEIERRLLNCIAERLPWAEAVVVSDYAKGVVTTGLMGKLASLCRRAGRPLLVDPKGRDFVKYRGASVITPNAREAREASGLSELEKAARRFLSRLELEAVLITRGREGVSGLSSEGVWHIPARAREVYDVTGAGDTFIATLGLARASNLSWPKAAAMANLAAGLVVGKLGAAAVSPGELIAALQEEPERKLRTLEELRHLAASLRSRGKRIVFTNGCFDLLHVGHIRLLQNSRQLGDVLIVGLDTDESVRAVKGPGRPLMDQRQRAQLIAALGCVDYVVLFEGEKLEDLIRVLRPDVLTKGDDHRPEEVVGREIVESYGGQVVLIPTVSGLSSSGMIERIWNTR